MFLLHYDEQARIFSINGMIDDELAAEFCMRLKMISDLDKGALAGEIPILSGNEYDYIPPEEYIPKKITVFLNSVGGELPAGYACYDAIQLCETELEIIATGQCYSAATFLLLASKNRKCTANTRFMVHRVLVSIDEWSKAKQIKKDVALIEQWVEPMLEIYKTETKYVFDEKDEDYYFFAKEALALGFVKEICTKKGKIE